ncbi:MAG: antibiotic biosynthesis monooxygenase [Acidobacteriota bacterium]
MMARIWRGETKVADTAAYLEVLRATGVPDYLATDGNRGVWVFTRPVGEETEFVVLTLWTSREAIAGFAGDDIEQARYYPEDEKYLLRFTPTVEHYECAIAEGSVSQPDINSRQK